jgi:hypothetical protein
MQIIIQLFAIKFSYITKVLKKQKQKNAHCANQAHILTSVKFKIMKYIFFFTND